MFCFSSLELVRTITIAIIIFGESFSTTMTNAFPRLVFGKQTYPTEVEQNRNKIEKIWVGSSDV